MSHVLRFTAFIAAIVGPASLAFAQAAIQEELPTMVEQTGGDVQRHVDVILHAPDPSTAVAAYAAAKSVLPDSSKIDQAYLRRMVDFGLPQMADAQARMLVQHDPKDGLAWGVIAFSLATRGQTADALKDIATAARYLPDDPFIQRTAGQLLAWYDTVADKSTLPDVIKNSVQGVRSEMAAQRAYVDAYQAARATYEQGANPAEAPASAEVPPPAAAEEPVYAGDGGYDYGAPYTYGYTSPYDYGYYGYPTYAYAYPGYGDYFPYWGGFYGGYWWPGTFSSIIVPDDFFFHNRFFHHEPDLDDFIGFPGHRFDHRFVGRDDHRSFGDHRGFGHFGGFDQRRGLAGNRGFVGNRSFVGNGGFATRAPQFNRGFTGRAPLVNRGFAGRAPMINRGFAGRAPQHFAAPRMPASPRFAAAPHSGGFAAAPHFGGGGGHIGGGHGGHR